MTHQEKLHLIKLGLHPKECVPKGKKPLSPKSKKKIAEENEQKESGTDEGMDKFFISQRRYMSGKCLFCNQPSFKNNDERFHFSIAHLLPKRPVKKGGFPSVGTNENNWIELCWNCHTDFDRGMITWEFIFDSKEWKIISEKLHSILPLVAEEERKHKLYSRLTELLYGKA